MGPNYTLLYLFLKLLAIFMCHEKFSRLSPIALKKYAVHSWLRGHSNTGSGGVMVMAGLGISVTWLNNKRWPFLNDETQTNVWLTL